MPAALEKHCTSARDDVAEPSRWRRQHPTGIPSLVIREETFMKFPTQARPVARAFSQAKDTSASVVPSDCCGAGKCCLGACLFGNCAGVCVPNIGQC